MSKTIILCHWGHILDTGMFMQHNLQLLRQRFFDVTLDTPP